MQTISANLTAALLTIDARVDPRRPLDVYEFYSSDSIPGVDGFDPADASEAFSSVSITWNGIAYRRAVKARSDIIRNMGEKTNSVTLTFSNLDRYPATWAQTTQVEGLILVIRTIVPSVTDDSIVIFVGRCGKPSDIDKQEFHVNANQDFGNINQELPPDKFIAEDPNGYLPGNVLYEGFRFIAINGTFTWTTREVSPSLLGSLLGRQRTVRHSEQWSSLDLTPYGEVVPEVFGRCQMQGIPIAFQDDGYWLEALHVWCKGPLLSIDNVQQRDKAFYGIFDILNHTGEIGGTGDPSVRGGAIPHLGGNFTEDFRFPGAGLFSKTAYTGSSILQGAVDGPIVISDPPLLTALIMGRDVDLPDSSGVYNLSNWSDNPVHIARFILTNERFVNIDPAFMEDSINWLTGLHCDEPLVDDSNGQLIVVPNAEILQAGVTFFRYQSSARLNPRWVRYNLLGDTAIIPEVEDGPYTGFDQGDIPSQFTIQRLLTRRYTCNVPITSSVRAVDFLYKTIFPSFKGYLRINKRGKYEIRSEQASDATRLRAAIAVGATAALVLDVTPWKTGPDLLQGRLLTGNGLTTSEVRTILTADFSTSGNAITLTSGGTGGMTATASGATLTGGSTTVQASGTVTIGGVAGAGRTISATIDGILTTYTLESTDTVNSSAAMLAAYINADPRLKQYISATWLAASPTIITIRCKHGALNLDSALLKAHTGPVADPLVAPTIAASAGALGAGTYSVAYSNVTATGSTALTPTSPILLTASQKIDVSGLPAFPAGVTSRKFYISDQAGSGYLRYVVTRTDAVNFSINVLPLPEAAQPPSYNTSAEELIRVAMSFATNSQDIYPVWSPGTLLILNAIYLPTVPNGHKYEVTTAGTTGTTEPSPLISTRATAFGDSQTKGTTGPSDLPHSYAVLVTTAKGWALTNLAVDGSQAADQADAIYLQTVSGTDRTYWYAIGTNDQRLYLTDAGKRQVFTDAHSAELAWLSIPETAKIRGLDTDWVYAGSWSSTVAYGLGKNSSATGATATVSIRGSTIYLGTIVQDGNAGAYTVKVDGITIGTYSSAPAGTIATLLGRAYAPRLIRISGLASGVHTVVVEVTSSGGGNVVYVDWISGNEESGFLNGPNVYVGNVGRCTAAGYAAHGGSDANVLTYNGVIEDNADLLSGDGLKTQLVDFHSVVNPAIHTTGDGLHWNDAGHEAVKTEFLIEALSWPNTGGTVTSGSAVFTEIGATYLSQTGLTRANVKKDTYKWPLGGKQSSVNQIKGKFRDAKNDFALTPFTINDRDHQDTVKKIYPLEADLQAVDNWHQANRLGNWLLSKNREGDWFNSLEGGPQCLVLEEGDIICASDDSGGLINVVTRIEELRIKPNHDVAVSLARKYSTLMFSDDVSQHTIPLPSVLRYRQTVDSLVEFIDNFPIRDEDGLTPGFYVAVSRDLSLTGDWRGWALYADYGDGYVKIAEGDIPAKIGEATTTLGILPNDGMPAFDPSIFDRKNSVTFTLKYGPPAPAPAPFATVTEQELLSNSRRNLFLIENEYVQAATVVDNGNQSYTISTLLRGRFGTDGSQLVHGATERVVFLDGSEKFVTIDPVRLNGAYNYKAVTTNQDVADATPVSFTWTGGNIKPLAPVNLQGVRDTAGNLLIKWTRRSRMSPGLRSYSDLPVAEEQERYLVEVFSGSTLKRSWQVDKTVFTPILWTFHPDSLDGPMPEGGINHSEFDPGNDAYSQQQFSEDVTVVFTASDQGPELPSYFSIVPEVPVAHPKHYEDLYYWQGGSVGSFDTQPEEQSSLLVTAVARDRFTIELKGGVARYYFKSALIYTSLVKTTSSPLRVAAQMMGARNQFIGTAHIQGIATNAHYGAYAQVEDGLALGIKVRVRQLSAVVGQGDYVEGYL